MFSVFEYNHEGIRGGLQIKGLLPDFVDKQIYTIVVLHSELLKRVIEHDRHLPHI